MKESDYQALFEPGEDPTPYRLLTKEYVSTATFEGKTVLKIAPEALKLLTARAFRDVSYFLRSGHLEQVRNILDDPESSENDYFVAVDMLRNAAIAANGVLPMCQDTGTAIVMGKKGQQVWTAANDEYHVAAGIEETYTGSNLRYSQNAPLDMYNEVNTGNNLPAQIEIMSVPGDTYKFFFMAKGGGSANKTFLFQKTKALLTPDGLMKFLEEEIPNIGTAGCPPYHLAIVVGGLSAEMTLKTVKLASARYLDALPTSGNKKGRAFRDLEIEQQVLEMTQKMGLGAQFGGKHYCLDVRVIRLPRHGASCPVGIGVSCSADRQILGKITSEGVFLEQLEENPLKHLEGIDESRLSGEVVQVNLEQPMDEIRKQLSQYPLLTRLSLKGPMVVARDIAHAKLEERLERGEGLPQYVKDHIIYYAGPAKKPQNMPSGSFGPTTAGRMDPYVDLFMQNGGSFITLAKGNRSAVVAEACKKHGGFYLGSIGGPAARLAQDCIKKVEVLEYEELGMEAIWRIEVENFPAFILVDDKGNDFFKLVREKK